MQAALTGSASQPRPPPSTLPTAGYQLLHAHLRDASETPIASLFDGEDRLKIGRSEAERQVDVWQRFLCHHVRDRLDERHHRFLLKGANSQIDGNRGVGHDILGGKAKNITALGQVEHGLILMLRKNENVATARLSDGAYRRLGRRRRAKDYVHLRIGLERILYELQLRLHSTIAELLGKEFRTASLDRVLEIRC